MWLKREHKKIKKSVINHNVSNKEYCKYFSLINLFDITLNSSLLKLKNKNSDGKCRNLLRKMSKWQLFLTTRPLARLIKCYWRESNNFVMVALVFYISFAGDNKSREFTKYISQNRRFQQCACKQMNNKIVSNSDFQRKYFIKTS